MRRSALLFLLAPLASSVLVGQAEDVPLSNWTVPPYTRASAGGMTTMTDVTPPRLFVGVQPCRVADTRGNAAPIQGGIFANSQQRTWDVTNVCGIPSGADAVSVNFSVVSPAATPLGAFLLAWPTGQPAPPTAIMTYGPGATVISNAAIVPLGPGEQLNVNVSHSTHVIMDINGYFSDRLGNGENFLQLVTNSNQFTARFLNESTTCESTCGVSVATESGHALQGTAFQPNAGVYGVVGHSFGTSGSVGVWGGAGGLMFPGLGYSPVGVRGTAIATGVLGIAQVHGVIGDLLDLQGAIVARGILGFDGGATKYAVWGGTGNMGGTGVKSFVEPHPSDPSKVIRYVALEGPEAGTYFRGRGKFDRGIARIPVPEDFRIVTDEEGLTVQVTPIGPLATVSVVKFDLNEIVVQSSRNVEFFYSVQGVRRAFRDFSPIGDGREFLPQSADARIPEGLPEESRRRLIANGTYKPDGTVNMETAQRLGWDRIWNDRARPEPQPASR